MSRDERAQYYDAGGIETLDIVRAKLTREQYIGFLLGTSLVYQCRMMHKWQTISDARKAANYSKWLADELDRANDIAEPAANRDHGMGWDLQPWKIHCPEP